MNLLYPEYFWLLLLLVPIFIKRNYKDIGFVSYLYMLTFILIIIALSRPVMQQEPIKSEQILSDVIVAVDLSYSMSATDVKPSRLGRAKEILKELARSEKNSRFAVVGFTTNAIVLSPLTEDSELLLHLYDAMDTKMIITKGSSVMPALKLASKMSKSKTPSVVILSDGADELSYEAEAKFAKKRGLVVNTFMLATTEGGTLSKDDGELLKDELGDIVVSRSNDKISQISSYTGGIYTKSFSELRDALETQRNREYKTQTMIVRNMEFFYYFIVLAIIVFLISVTTLKKYVLMFLLLFGVNLNAELLESFYEIVDENRANFNKATEYYKIWEYEKALVNYEMVKSSNEEFKSVIYYNIGNSYIRLKEFKKAREAYLKSLTLFYSKEADENLRYIKNVAEQEQMSTGQQKTSKKSSMAKQEKSSKKSKSGGSSNMKVSASASSGANDMGKKTKSESMLNLNKGNAKLSSKQYELINKRGANEKKPW
ncbi:VWA domain-containing protein [Sulfurimonas sp.]